jgi:membrane fusion protein, multidrug efflux system
MKRFFFNSLLILVLSNSSCDNKTGNLNTGKDDSLIAVSYDQKSIKVKTSIAAFKPFDRIIYSNGKANAKNMAEIRFGMDEMIVKIFIQNGQKVFPGQLLAKLDDRSLLRKLAKIQEAVNKSLIELDDRLIDYGFRIKDTAVIPKDILKMAKIKSNYTNALFDYNDVKYEIERTNITAPVGGIVANVDAKINNYSSNYKRLCNIIDLNEMQVNFMLLENEVSSLRAGTPVDIKKYDNNSIYHGTISTINPVIDEDGMVLVTATIINNTGLLLGGQQVNVIVKQNISMQLVVPKGAVLVRDNRKVVFTVIDKMASWNYVQTGAENNEYIIIEEGLKPGEVVIISNNVTLVNSSPVEIIK